MCEAVIAVFVCVVQSVKQTVAERLRQLRHTRPVLAKFRTVLALPCLRLDRPKGLVNTVDDLYIGLIDVTESMVTIRSPCCGYNVA